jgi:hypothetical protein
VSLRQHCSPQLLGGGCCGWAHRGSRISPSTRAPRRMRAPPGVRGASRRDPSPPLCGGVGCCEQITVFDWGRLVLLPTPCRGKSRGHCSRSTLGGNTGFLSHSAWAVPLPGVLCRSCMVLYKAPAERLWQRPVHLGGRLRCWVASSPARTTVVWLPRLARRRGLGVA